MRDFRTIVNLLLGAVILYIFQALFFLPSLFLHLPQVVGWLLGICSEIAGGILLGWMSKKKGWLFSGKCMLLLGIIYIMGNLLGLILFSLYPKLNDSNIPPYIAISTMFKNIMNLPINVALAVIGGLIGEHLHRKYIKSTV